MWSRLLCSWLVLGCLLGATKAKRGYQDIVGMMAFDGVEVSIVWERCGQVNAYYYPAEKQVILCTELQGEPEEVLRFIVAHELAHAVIHQRGIIMTRRQHELAADELAAVMLGVTGNQQALFYGARWLERQDDLGLGTHPSSVTRAYILRCAAWESQRVEMFGCKFWANMVSTWVYLLKMG